MKMNAYWKISFFQSSIKKMNIEQLKVADGI